MGIVLKSRSNRTTNQSTPLPWMAAHGQASSSFSIEDQPAPLRFLRLDDLSRTDGQHSSIIVRSCRRSVDNSSLVPRRTNLGHQLLNGWCASQSVLSSLCCPHLHPPARTPARPPARLLFLKTATQADIKEIQDTSQAIHQQTVTDASRPKPSVVLGGSHKSTRTQNSSSIPNEVSSPLFNFVDDSTLSTKQHSVLLQANLPSHWKAVW